MYELVTGMNLDGNDDVIDHLCRNRPCVRPTHLELVTNRENIMRGDSFVAALASKGKCSKGHEYTEENTGYYRKNGEIVGRRCKTCLNAKMRAYRKTPKGRESHNRQAREYRTKIKDHGWKANS
ncbi:HNH endonuclease [Mycolicibacterium neoaurum]